MAHLQTITISDLFFFCLAHKYTTVGSLPGNKEFSIEPTKILRQCWIFEPHPFLLPFTLWNRSAFPLNPPKHR